MVAILRTTWRMYLICQIGYLFKEEIFMNIDEEVTDWENVKSPKSPTDTDGTLV